MTDLYYFTYEYNNGDRYLGYGYDPTDGTYYAGKEIFPSSPNETGNLGKYTITSVHNLDSANYSSLEGRVYIYLYEDAITSTGAAGYSSYYGHTATTLTYNPSFYTNGGLGNEYSYAYGELANLFSPYYQADVINTFYLTPQYDEVYGMDGNDIIAGAFTDLFQNDYVHGGEAIDTLAITGDSEYLVEVYAGNSTNQLNIPGTIVLGFENFDFSGFTTDVNFYGAAGTNNTFLGGSGTDTVDYTGLGAKVILKAQGIIEKGNGGQDIVRADIIIGDAGFANAINASSSSTTPIIVDLSTGSLTVVGLPSGDATFTVINFVDVTGSQLADTITGDDQNNTFSGQAGDDFFIGSGGSDIIIGGNDLDTVDYSQLEAQITLKAQGIIEKEGIGSDTVQVETIIGNSNFENVIDASFSSTTPIIVDLSENNLTVAGLPSGDATFTVANFVDVIGTQTGDTIKGNGDDNTLDGQAGDDEFFGTDGSDTIIGGQGFDSLDYTFLTGAITLKALGVIDKGELGIDTVQVESITSNSEYINVIDASDSTTKSITVDLAANFLTVTDISSFNVFNFTNVIGTSLADSIKGNALNNYLDGKSGNDTLIGGIGADTLQGGIGIDTASYVFASAGIRVNLTTGQGTLNEANGDVLLNIENVTGSAFADNITGNNLANTLDGGVGVSADILSGAAGNDSLLGGDGNDNLTGGLGADTLNGGNGIDTASYSLATAAVTVNLTTGTGTLGEANGDVLSNIENLTGSNFNDSLTGNVVSNTLLGNNGNDTINGLGGNDALNGGANNDTLNGGLGQDTLTGGLGNDTHIFQFGQSTVNLADRITDFAFGTDKIDLLTSLGLATPAPLGFSRAANNSATTLISVVNSVFADANGALVGSQALGINRAALVLATNTAIAGTYLIVNDGINNFQQANDLVVNLTGYTGTLPALGNITPTSVFV